MHITINGGVINIASGDDGINTSNEGISVTTINNGELNIHVTDDADEGDGIDSNGWLVINGGVINSQGHNLSMDSGIDADSGIYINNGTIIASGNMLDEISNSTQNYAVFNFSKSLGAGKYTLRTLSKQGKVEEVISFNIENDFTSLFISTTDLVNGEYTLWYNDKQLVGCKNLLNEFRGFRDFRDEVIILDGVEEKPRVFNEHSEPKDVLELGNPGDTWNMPNSQIGLSEVFSIESGANYFGLVSIKEERSYETNT